MAARRTQQVGIWIITLTMLLGTVGGFVAMMVAPSNEARDRAAIQEARDQYKAASEEYQKKIEAQAKELSDKYFTEFSAYQSRVAAFNAEEVTELKTEDLKVGDGEEAKEDTKIAVYYIGWNPSGKIFDQSIEGEFLRSPLNIDGPASAQVIEGWQKGLVGMKIGGVRELTIPSDLAYGESGQGEDIPANTPLKFVVMAIAQPEEIPQPEMPKVLKDYYKKLYGGSL